MGMADEEVNRTAWPSRRSRCAQHADAGAAVQDDQRAVLQADLDAGTVAAVPHGG